MIKFCFRSKPICTNLLLSAEPSRQVIEIKWSAAEQSGLLLLYFLRRSFQVVIVGNCIGEMIDCLSGDGCVSFVDLFECCLELSERCFTSIWILFVCSISNRTPLSLPFINYDNLVYKLAGHCSIIPIVPFSSEEACHVWWFTNCNWLRDKWNSLNSAQNSLSSDHDTHQTISRVIEYLCIFHQYSTWKRYPWMGFVPSKGKYIKRRLQFKSFKIFNRKWKLDSTNTNISGFKLHTFA